MKLYNSLTRQKEEFVPIVAGQAAMYTCGPTVYNYAHIGNFRAYIAADILKRALQLAGYTVNHVMNITDVDDKMIKGSQEAGEVMADFAARYEQIFMDDLKKLNIIPADHYPRATAYIDQMVAIIESLIEKGFAYKADDGSVYFAIAKMEDYGQLSHLEKDVAQHAQARIRNDDYDKENAQDFALWKAWYEPDGDVYWETSLGKGRPGWHIECSAMSTALLGNHFDIHTGGVDLMFPHHENEIAQSECSTGEQFVNYWIHNEHVLVDNKKMSKSLGNFYTLKDLEDRGYDPMAYRYLTLQTHYRQKMNFTLESLDAAAAGYAKLTAWARLLDVSDDYVPADGEVELPTFEALYDDLNTAETLAQLHAMVKSDKTDAEKAALLWIYDQALGLGLAAQIGKGSEKEVVPAEIMNLVAQREQARLHLEWSESDRLREEIKKQGYEVRDTDKGPEVVKI